MTGRSVTNRRARVALDGSTAQALETGRTRLLVAGMMFAVAFLVIGWRLVDVAVLSAGARHAFGSPGEPPVHGRADIVDRNGVILATSLPSVSLYANPHEIRDPRRAARRLAEVLPELSESALSAKLDTDGSFIWLRRDLTPRQADRVNRLGIPGLHFKEEQRRIYPHSELTAHVVGFTDIDDRGLAGIEQSFDEVLRDSAEPVALSLDVRVQYAVARELADTIERFSAIGATGLVMDARSGELLAMASLPEFDPTKPGDAPDDARFNRATLGVYEMGSVFKIFTTALALDSGAVSLQSGFDVSRPIRVARYTITDYKPKGGWLSVPEIFMYSSNIGTVHMALAAGTQTQRAYLNRLGLMRPASVELGEVGDPMLPLPWREINTMTVAFGHGMAVSPVQLISAVGAVVNGGLFRPATLIRQSRFDRTEGRQVLRPSTSEKMRRLMRLVVQHGTGRKANAPGFRVGGKTGTADKLVNGRYVRDRRVASFVAAFPIEDPRYVIFVMVDEPEGIEETFGYATGGWVAAPAVRRIVERIGPMLGIEPATEDPDSGEALLVKARAKAQHVAAN